MKTFGRLTFLLLLCSVATGFVSLGAAPRLTVADVDSSRGVDLNLHGDAGVSYTVEVSADLRNWTALVTGTATNGMLAVHHDSGAAATFFYRAKTAATVSEQLRLSSRLLRMGIGEEGRVIALVSTGAVVNWSSSDAGIATVDTNGQVKAVAKGSAVITATAGDQSGTCVVMVYETSGANPDPAASTLIATALAENRITSEEALIYRVFDLFGDERLPVEFQGAPSEGANRSVLREVSERLGTLSAAAQGILRPFLLPPIYDQSWFARRLGLTAPPPPAGLSKADITVNCSAGLLGTEFWPRRSTAHFNIFYFGLMADTHAARAAELIASVIEEVYQAETTLFNRTPKPDTGEPCSGGDGAVDIYLTPGFGSPGTAGIVHSYPGRCENVPSYMTINSLGSIMLLAASAVPEHVATSRRYVKAVLAHEFLHVLQLTIDRAQDCDDYEWLDEATSEWVMDYVDSGFNLEDGFIKVDPSRRRSGTFFANYLFSDHMSPIEVIGHETDANLNGYSDYIFFQYLAKKYGNEIIREITDGTVGRGSVEAIEGALGARGGFKNVWPEFAKTIWNDAAGGLLKDWSTWDNYDYGLATVFSPASRISKPGLKTIEVDQRGQPSAKFTLLQNAIRNSIQGNYEIFPRSFFYEHLKFTDENVRSVLFFNPIAAYPADRREFIRVEVWQKIGGAWKAPEIWTAETHKFFCRDVQDERIEELLIIVSNSDPDRSRGVPLEIDKRIPMQVSTSNVGCWQWEGHSSVQFSGMDGTTRNGSATATFERTGWFGLSGRQEFVTISGIAQGNQVTPLGDCTITLDAAQKAITTNRPPDGTIMLNLDLDLGMSGFGGEPPDRKALVLVGGSTISTVNTFACPGFNQSSTGDAAWEWLQVPNAMDYAVSADGKTLEGRLTQTAPFGTSTTTFKFNAKRQ